MKRLFLLTAMGLLAVGCASSNKTQNTEEHFDSLDVKYQIVDQEFDNLVVPNDRYNQVAPYEEQINGTSYIKSSSSTRKSSQKPKVRVQKTVVDGQGNILPDGTRAPIADEEALPDEYKKGEAY